MKTDGDCLVPLGQLHIEKRIDPFIQYFCMSQHFGVKMASFYWIWKVFPPPSKTFSDHIRFGQKGRKRNLKPNFAVLNWLQFPLVSLDWDEEFDPSFWICTIFQLQYFWAAFCYIVIYWYFELIQDFFSRS